MQKENNMKPFLYGLLLQWKMNLRNKDIVVFYYLVPLLFYLFMSTVFIAIIPNVQQTLIASMTIFGITMGGILGSPYPLIELFSYDIRKSYQVANIPLYTLVLSNFLSAFIHLLIMSLIIFISAPLLFQVTLPADILHYLLSLILILCTTLSIGTIFGLYVKSSAKLAMYTQIIFLPSIVLSGIMFPLDLLPSFLQICSFLLPATWGYQLLAEIPSSPFPLFLLTGICLYCIYKRLITYKKTI